MKYFPCYVYVSALVSATLSHITFVLRSYVSFSCRCFPDLLARSIHFPLNHLMVGFFSNDSAFTLATNVMFSPAQKNNLACGLSLRFCCYFVYSVMKVYKLSAHYVHILYIQCHAISLWI